MHFDDRLGTVLRLSASGPAVQRIQYRQLLDLLGTSPADARGDQLDAAFVRLGQLAQQIPEVDRARAIADAGLRLRSPRLIATLAQDAPQVAAAALHRARLSTEEWLDLIPALHPAARSHLHGRRDLPAEITAVLARLGVSGGALPLAEAAPAALPEDALSSPEPASDRPESGISAIVRRIEAYRKSRQANDQSPTADSPRLPLGEDAPAQTRQVRAFDFATDALGRINWSDPGVGPMVSGMRMSGTAIDPDLAVLVRQHQPLRAHKVMLAGAEAISGAWQLDAAPWFDPLTGRFQGYRGRMRRPAEPAQQPPPVTDSQADRIRQMLHELRTPVNAIQGFAEVIQQQLFGPTPHEYRALAAGIAGDAARMLSAFEELERLARLDSGAMELECGETDLAAVLGATISQLAAHTAPRGSGFALTTPDIAPWLALDRLEVERIVWRLLATLAGVSAPGEVLRADLARDERGLRLELALPAVLAAQDGDTLFEAAAGAIAQTVAAGVFGVGFALRLARAEARAAGGDLIRSGDALHLTLPGLTAGGRQHTEDHGAAN